MKNKILTAVLGASVVMAAVTGCSSSNKNETEAQTLELLELEIVDESEIFMETADESESESAFYDESESSSEQETLEIDISQEDETEESESEITLESSGILNDNTENTTEPESSDTSAVSDKMQPTPAKDAAEKDTKDTEETVIETTLETEKTQTVKGKHASGSTAKRPESSGKTNNNTAQQPETELMTESEEQSETAAETESETMPEPETEEKPRLQLAVTTDRVNIRSNASIESEALGLLIPGSRVILLEQIGEWSRVKFESENDISEGYIKSEYLTSAANLYQAKEKVNLRKEPDQESEKLGSLETGAQVVVTEKDGEWFRIVSLAPDDSVLCAYVKAEFLEEVTSDSSENIIAEFEAQNETETISETVLETTTESGLETESESESESETGSHTDSGDVSSSGSGTANVLADDQLSLAKELMPDLESVGVIYTEGDTKAESALTEMKASADSMGIELMSMRIIDISDIDLTASELVGKTDAILLLDDEIVNDLTETLVAYADEVGIPVIGFEKDQIDKGCSAAADQNICYFNRSELDKLGISFDDTESSVRKIYE